MKFRYLIFTGAIVITFTFLGILFMEKYSKNINTKNQYNIIFLHHSTGSGINNGGIRQIPFLEKFFKRKLFTLKWFDKYNRSNNTKYIFRDQIFPKREFYGWNNYPYDYYNVWVKNAGENTYMNEPTLEILAKQYNLIIFKHCFPVCDIEEEINEPDINSSEKTLGNYKLQYLALKKKLHEFPNTKFLIWTGAAQVENNITIEKAQRAKAFFDWVRTEWNTPNDNIYIWDFYELETEGGLFLKPEFARNPNDSHTNRLFAKRISPQFCQRIVEVIELNR